MTCPRCRQAQLVYAGILVVTKCSSQECGYTMTAGHYLALEQFMRVLPGLDPTTMEFVMDNLRLRRSR